MKEYKYRYLIESDSPSNLQSYWENDVNHIIFSCESDLVRTGQSEKVKFVVWNGDLLYLFKQILLLGLTKEQLAILLWDLDEVYRNTTEKLNK